MPAATGFTLITASHIYGSLSGELLSSGQIQFTAISTNTGSRISFEVNGSGQMVSKPFSFPIVNGVIVAGSDGITPQLPDVSLTNPQNIGYAVSIIDPLTGQNILGPGYVIQPTGATFNFDAYTPALGAQVTIQVGPQGLVGPASTVPGPTGPKGDKGDTGATGAPGSVSMIAPLLSAVVSMPTNLFDQAKVVLGKYPNPADGAILSYGPGSLTNLMLVNGVTAITANINLGAGGYGVVYYDSNGAFVSSLTSPTSSTSSSWTFNVPTGAYYARSWYPTASMAASAIMVVADTTLPSSYVSFGPYLASQSDTNLSTAIAAVNTSIATTNASLGNAAALAITQALPVRVNLLDTTLSRWGVNQYVDYRDGIVRSFTGGYVSPLVPLQAGAWVANFPTAWNPVYYDSIGNYIGYDTSIGAGGTSSTAGVAMSAPAGTQYVRFWLQLVDPTTQGFPSSAGLVINTQLTSTPIVGNIGFMGGHYWVSLANFQLVQGSTLPSTVQPFYSTDFATKAFATAVGNQSALRPYFGTNLGWAGDSISAGYGSGAVLSPLVASILGATVTSDVSWPGRRASSALDNSGATGQPFLTSAIVSAIDTFVYFLGTNLDDVSNIGNVADTPSVGVSNANGITFPSTDSYCSILKGVLNQLLAWNPYLRIIIVTPYQSSIHNVVNPWTAGPGAIPEAISLEILQATVAADKAIGELYGIPVIDLYAESGINPANIVALTTDSAHPNFRTQTTRLAPMIARKMLAYAAV